MRISGVVMVVVVMWGCSDKRKDPLDLQSSRALLKDLNEELQFANLEDSIKPPLKTKKAFKKYLKPDDKIILDYRYSDHDLLIGLRNNRRIFAMTYDFSSGRVQYILKSPLLSSQIPRYFRAIEEGLIVPRPYGQHLIVEERGEYDVFVNRPNGRRELILLTSALDDPELEPVFRIALLPPDHTNST